ncbi:sigma-70 family RNA polymerase sigma factor [Variovorax sp. efr-133-TYG-130]|uniref:sigma-70 family RNA polymerase sigma factor n=1 Tax=Variovorax sp. efr-133-TYG-130 TaxID=3040327 RepID=UPI0025550DB8|nr:sigma-70 family RNA polymerase sigma factor [Variovorax sp. efr-133-TYG-130]
MSAPAIDDSLHVLYRSHHGWLQSWLRRRLGCAEDAADLAHDAFVRLLTARSQVVPAELKEPRAYLTIIARGLVIDRFRRADLERAYLSDLAALPPDLHPSPEEQLQAVQALRALDELLASLTPKTRAAWLYSRLDGMTHAEIAQQLDVSVPRVRQYLATAARRSYEIRYGAALPEAAA